MSEEQAARKDRGAPRDFLQAWILLLLRNWQAHGYALQSALANAGFASLDHSVLYRELRSLEERGLLRSFWETGASGPARRTYAITEAGERMLGAWAEDMQNVQRQAAQFLGDYFKAWQTFTTQVAGNGSVDDSKQTAKRKTRSTK